MSTISAFKAQINIVQSPGLLAENHFQINIGKIQIGKLYLDKGLGKWQAELASLLIAVSKTKEEAIAKIKDAVIL